MTRQNEPASHDMPILYAEDDPDDRLLATMAFREAKVTNPLVTVEDGQDLLSYLRREGRFAAPGVAPRPGLILLDLNMPGIGGLEALAIIRADPALQRIPVVILTTSNAYDDIRKSYEAGANSYIVKPGSFEALITVIRVLIRYWFQVVEVPEN